jgi:hypothetical protein
MLTISEAQRRTELFLTGQMLEALRAVEYGLPALIPSCTDVDLAEVARARVEIEALPGPPESYWCDPYRIVPEKSEELAAA